jgi:hypothetical protein
MITKWWYEGRDGSQGRTDVKALIAEQNYRAIDVGAGIYFWSYPECKYVADVLTPSEFKIMGEGITAFTINLQDKSTWNELLEYVAQNGKFDYSICSHTLEDIYNPVEVIRLLEVISKKGFIAIPSKYEELTFLYGNYYRGNPHHKFIFNVMNNRLQILPKTGFTEKNPRSDELAKGYSKGIQLAIYWEDTVDCDLFGFVPVVGSDNLIHKYYEILEHEADA